MRKAADWTIKPGGEAPADSSMRVCFPPCRPTANISGTASTTSSATISGIFAACSARPTPPAHSASRREADIGSGSQRYRTAIKLALKRFDVVYFPPSWEKEGNAWGKPKRFRRGPLFAPDDPRVVALIPRASPTACRRLRRRHDSLEVRDQGSSRRILAQYGRRTPPWP